MPTVGQLLRTVRSRLHHEEAALTEDDAELWALLGEWAPALPPPARQQIEQALDATDGETAGRTITRLQEEAKRLRQALVLLIETIPEAAHPARAAGRAYLGHHLLRERPWQVDAFDGPRR